MLTCGPCLVEGSLGTVFRVVSKASFNEHSVSLNKRWPTAGDLQFVKLARLAVPCKAVAFPMQVALGAFHTACVSWQVLVRWPGSEGMCLADPRSAALGYQC